MHAVYLYYSIHNISACSAYVAAAQYGRSTVAIATFEYTSSLVSQQDIEYTESLSVQGDFCNMDKLPDDSFDGAYALEATCHAKAPVDVYREVYRVLKPGGVFIDVTWIMTDKYDQTNPEQVRIKNGILVRIGFPSEFSPKQS